MPHDFAKGKALGSYLPNRTTNSFESLLILLVKSQSVPVQANSDPEAHGRPARNRVEGQHDIGEPMLAISKKLYARVVQKPSPGIRVQPTIRRALIGFSEPSKALLKRDLLCKVWILDDRRHGEGRGSRGY